MKKEKLILICVAILGVSIILSQVIKQSSSNVQANARLEQERQALEYQKEKDAANNLEESLKRASLQRCLDNVEEEYWNYAELNGTGTRVSGVRMSTYLWNQAKENKESGEESCYKRYK